MGKTMTSDLGGLLSYLGSQTRNNQTSLERNEKEEEEVYYFILGGGGLNNKVTGRQRPDRSDRRGSHVRPLGESCSGRREQHLQRSWGRTARRSSRLSMTLTEGEQSREFFVKKETEELESTSFAVMPTWDQLAVCIGANCFISLPPILLVYKMGRTELLHLRGFMVFLK